MNKSETIRLITGQKLLPLYYHESETVSISVLKGLYDAGIRAIEYTNRGHKALDNFIALRKYAADNLPGLQLGIGTIKTITDAEQFIAAGAQFIVCPVVNPAIATICFKAGLLWIPGCLTPSEINLAEDNGATLIKIFPATILHPDYITALKDVFPGLLFMVTGGVDASEENLHKWFKAGVAAVGMGSKLIDRSAAEQNDVAQITSDTKSVLNIISRC